MNNNIKFRGSIQMTYNNYISLSTINTQPYLMISELIDNSIGSFERELGNDAEKWDEKEIVKVKIHFEMHPRGEYKKTHSYRHQPDSFITVTDNAFGMDSQTLFDSIKLDNKKNLGHTYMNIHGRGLKQAAFFFGMSLNIKTFDGKNGWKMEMDLTKVDDLDNDIVREVTPSSYNTRGTEIKISCIHGKRIIKKNSINDEIIEFLITRYWKFLQSKKLEIEITSNYELFHKVTLDHSIGVPTFQVVDKISDFLSNIEEEKRNDAINSIKKAIDQFSIDIVDKKTLSQIKKSFKEIFTNKANNDFKWSLDHTFNFADDDEKSRKFTLTFWKTGLKSNKARWRGIYIYEGNRAIYHGPKKGKAAGAYQDWFPGSSHSTGSIDNIFIGEMYIKGIKALQSINDKSEIQMDSVFKDEFDAFILANYKLFEKIILFIRGKDKEDKQAFKHLSVQKALETRYASYASKNVPGLISGKEISVSKDKEMSGIFKLNDEFWYITILPDNSNCNQKEKIIVSFNREPKTNNVTVTYNEQAEIWNYANRATSREFYGEVLYPILVALTQQFINFYYNNLKDPIKAVNNEVNKKKDMSDDIV